MSKIEELIAELCPNGVEYWTLSEIFNTRNGYTPSKSNSEYWENGTIPWFRMEDIRENGHILSDAIQHVNEKGIKGALFPENSLIIATSATIGEHALITVKSLANQRFTYLMLKDEWKEYFEIKFLFYYCYKLDDWCKEHLNQGSFASVDMKQFINFRFPVPPLEVQREIVRVLDNFTMLTAELTAELIARRKQYEYYSDYIFRKQENVDFIHLSDLVQIQTGKEDANAKADVGKYPFFTCDANPYKINHYAFDTEAILVSGNGSQIGHVNYYNGKFNAYQRTYIFSEFKHIDSKYLLLYLKRYIREYCMANSKKGSIPYITLPVLKKFMVPVPNMDSQKKIVNILSKFDHLCNDISEGLPAEIAARQKQYEYYRDKLLNFKEK